MIAPCPERTTREHDCAFHSLYCALSARPESWASRHGLIQDEGARLAAALCVTRPCAAWARSMHVRPWSMHAPAFHARAHGPCTRGCGALLAPAGTWRAGPVQARGGLHAHGNRVRNAAAMGTPRIRAGPARLSRSPRPAGSRWGGGCDESIWRGCMGMQAATRRTLLRLAELAGSSGSV